MTKDLDMLFDRLRNTEPYLVDGGFTSAVMAQIPEARELPLWLKNIIILSFTAIGSAIAATQLPIIKLVTISTINLYTTTNLFTTANLAFFINSIPALGIAVIAIFVFSYLVIWLAHTDKI